MYYKIFNIPVMSWIFRTAKAIPIAGAREDPELMQRAFDEIDAALADGRDRRHLPRRRADQGRRDRARSSPASNASSRDAAGAGGADGAARHVDAACGAARRSPGPHARAAALPRPRRGRRRCTRMAPQWPPPNCWKPGACIARRRRLDLEVAIDLLRRSVHALCDGRMISSRRQAASRRREQRPAVRMPARPHGRLHRYIKLQGKLMSAPPSFPPEQNYGPIPNYMVGRS